MMAELPFMATENIMMDAVKAGGDRQELHETYPSYFPWKQARHVKAGRQRKQPAGTDCGRS